MNIVLMLLAVLAAPEANHRPAPAPLCRVIASSAPSRVPWLINITVGLRPGCPQGGEAHLVLEDQYGNFDPINSFQTLTPCKQDTFTCSFTWAGVLPWQGWNPYWISRSGALYRVPVPKP